MDNHPTPPNVTTSAGSSGEIPHPTPQRVSSALRGPLAQLAQWNWLAYALALAGGLLAAAQLWTFAHFQESVLDEGAYVYKGWLFATGRYVPYQAGGPWTNHTPLAFLIPGVLQTVFEPGLRTARYAAVALALLMILGLWIVSRRMGGRWWAAAAVWTLALNPAMLKTYSTAVTQGLVAAMLVWTLVLTLGEDRRLWQIGLGSLLAGLMIMTRINMLPVAPLLALYLVWQSGWRAGLVSAVGSGLAVVGLHAVYWPDILQVWTRLPRTFTPFLDPWRLPVEYKGSWKPDVTPIGRVLSLFHAVRFNFVPMVGALASVALWPRRPAWKRDSDFRAAVLLAALFASLLLSHIWAALGKDYCVFCLAGYVAFFAPTGILLVILTLENWRTRLPIWLQALIAAVILIVSAGIGFGAFEQLGEGLYNLSIPRWMMLDFQPGSVPLGAVLINKYGVEAQALRRFLPLAFGLIFGGGVVLITLVAGLLARRAARRGRPSIAGASGAPAFGYWAALIFLAAGALLSPSTALGGGYGTYDCSQDVIASHEAAGHRLAEVIPPGAQVYWKGPLSAIPLLYVPEARIYPAQINDGYSMLEIGSDAETVTRFGRWNEALAHAWADEADVILIEERQFRGWLRSLVRSGGFEELEASPPTAACREDSAIRIFRRLP